MKEKRYFAKANSYATNVNAGFANTWDVLVFTTKKERDSFIENDSRIGTSAISKKEVTKWASNYSLTQNKHNAPRPFSGEYWGINVFYSDEEKGIVGKIEVCSPYDTHERLY